MIRGLRSIRHAASWMLAATAALAFAPYAAAQSSGAPGAPSPALPGGAPGSPEGGGEMWVAALFVVMGLLLIVVAAAKVADLRSKREAETVLLQAQIADAFLRDRALFGLPVVATAHVPFVKGSPVTIEVTGHVPSGELGQAAMCLVEREASRTRPDVRILDRLEVAPAMAARAA